MMEKILKEPPNRGIELSEGFKGQRDGDPNLQNQMTTHPPQRSSCTIAGALLVITAEPVREYSLDVVVRMMRIW